MDKRRNVEMISIKLAASNGVFMSIPTYLPEVIGVYDEIKEVRDNAFYRLMMTLFVFVLLQVCLSVSTYDISLYIYYFLNRYYYPS